MSSVHENLRVSLIKFCNERIAEFKTATPEPMSSDATFLDFDAHATMTSLPDNDCVGIKGFSWVEANKLAEVDVLFGVSTVNDTNLFRQHRMIGALAEMLQYERQIKIIDADTGAEIGIMVCVEGTQVLPIPGTTTRPVQFLSVSMKTDLPAKASP